MHDFNARHGLIALMCVIYLSGCRTMEQTAEAIPDTPDETLLIEAQKRVIDEQQKRIADLEAQLAEKNVVIKQKNIREKEQEQVLEAASHEITHAQIKLHRLATKPSSASLIAEAEMAMNVLNQKPISDPADDQLKQQAQQLLTAAGLHFSRDDYALATHYASQSIEYANMIADINRHKPNRVTVAFNSPIRLKVVGDVNLRRMPGLQASVMSVLKSGTYLTANAYQGNWLRVQTDQNQLGWVSNTLVNVNIEKMNP